jgi:tetratricopeptide (TPR) repeat protein
LGKQNPDAFDPAPMQNNLGNVLAAIGRRERSAAALRQAAQAYCAILKGSKIWATAQNNLCRALLNIADVEHDRNQLKQLNLAVCACVNALQKWPRERERSDDWAKAQDNLGMVLTKIGELESDPARLRQAVDAHNCALVEWTKAGRSPQAAEAKYNLGKALVALGNITGDASMLEEAVTAFRDASDVPNLAPEDQAENQTGLGDAAFSLGERTSNVAYLEGGDRVSQCFAILSQRQGSLKDEADALQKTLDDVESLLTQQQGDGSASLANASKRTAAQTSITDSPTCVFSQSGCGDVCLALESNSTGN